MQVQAPWDVRKMREKAVDFTAGAGGTGSATVLPMSDDEKAEAAKRVRTIGFDQHPGGEDTR